MIGAKYNAYIGEALYELLRRGTEAGAKFGFQYGVDEQVSLFFRPSKKMIQKPEVYLKRNIKIKIDKKKEKKNE